MTHDGLIHPPPSHARRSAETWAAARADYLGGASAAEVCERHSLSLSTFRWRARTEGWRRSDQIVGSPFAPLDEEELDLMDNSLPLNAADMARLAWSNAARAMREGKLIEARGWTRLHDDLTKIADHDNDVRRTHLRWSQNPEWAARIPTSPPLRPVEDG
nr:hypothetical protein [uncultured Brevundimonas sp.]